MTRMTTIELKGFVLDYCAGRIFTSAHVNPPDMIGMVFMPLGLGGLKELKPGEIEDIGLVWEYIAAAGSRLINGMPLFTSCRLMHKDDLDIVRPLIEIEMQRLKDYVSG